MSEQQADYLFDAYFAPMLDGVIQSETWRNVGRGIETSIQWDCTRPWAQAIVERAADLATLADYGATAALELRIIAGVERVVLSDLCDPDAVRAFEGANAIAEAAAFVRQNGGGE